MYRNPSDYKIPIMFGLFILGLALAVTQAVPEGYILKVEQDCGTYSSGSVTKSASVTIKSDLHVQARVICAGPNEVKLNPINETSYESTLKIVYSESDTGYSSGDCKFNQQNDNSTLYAVEVAVAWGLYNDSLMDEYQTYTLTCTLGDFNTSTSDVKEIDNALAPMEVLNKNLGSAYKGEVSVKLLDVLGQEITSSKIPQGKKMFIEVAAVANNSESGVTPYNCYAETSTGDNRYDLLVAGCGDGDIFSRSEGFTTNGLKAKSPMFRAFQLRAFTGNRHRISFTCEITMCSDPCDGSSCGLRAKRSVDPEDRIVIRSPVRYVIEDRAEEAKQEIREVKVENQMKVSEVKILGVGSVALIALLLAVVAVVRVEQRRSEEKRRSDPSA